MKRALALLAPAVLVVGLVACGDDDDSPDTTTATETTESQPDDTEADATDTAPTTDSGDTEAGGSVADSELLGQIFPNLNRDQIECLVDEIGDSAKALDPAQAQAAADACDIDPDDLVPDMSAVSIPDLAGVSVPENMDELIGQVFPDLDDEQVSCLVDAIGDDFDASKAAQLADDCNIDPADLVPG
jgi:hypothetical protein